MLMADCCTNNWFFAINWDINSMVMNNSFFFSWLPTGPVEPNSKIISSDEGSKEIQVVSFSVYADECDAIFCSKGEDGRYGES